jgi:hypothetical protein
MNKLSSVIIAVSSSAFVTGLIAGILMFYAGAAVLNLVMAKDHAGNNIKQAP